MTRAQRAKVWVKKHQEKLALAGVGTVIVGFVYAVVKADMAYRERENAKLNGRIDALNAWNREEGLGMIYALDKDVHSHIHDVYNTVNQLIERDEKAS